MILKRDVLPPTMHYIVYNSNIADDDKSKATLFNDYFESVYSKSNSMSATTCK